MITLTKLKLAGGEDFLQGREYGGGMKRITPQKAGETMISKARTETMTDTAPKAAPRDRVLARMEREIAASPYPGVMLNPGGTPLLATTGPWLVVHGAGTLQAASAKVAAAVPSEDGAHPAPKDCARLLSEAAAAHTGAGGVATIEIDMRATKPDPEIYVRGQRAWLDERERRTLAVMQAVGALDRARTAKLGIGPARLAVAEAQRKLRELAEPVTMHAIRVGPARFDLRVVYAAMRALGVRRATLEASGALDAGVLHTSEGVGLVMPYRA